VADIKKLLESFNKISESEDRSVKAPQPRNVVAKNAKTAGAGRHKNPKEIEGTRREKHKKDFLKDIHEEEKQTRTLRKIEEAYSKFKKDYAEGKMHTSPSGVRTNMDPSDDDYEINYGKNGVAANMKKEGRFDDDYQEIPVNDYDQWNSLVSQPGVQKHWLGNHVTAQSSLGDVIGEFRVSRNQGYVIKKFAKQGMAEDNLEEYGDTARGQKRLAKVHHRAADRVTSKQADRDPAHARKAQQTQDRAWERLAVKEQGVAEGRKDDSLDNGPDGKLTARGEEQMRQYRQQKREQERQQIIAKHTKTVKGEPYGVAPSRISQSRNEVDWKAANKELRKKGLDEQGVAEAGPFSYGAKKPRKGSVAYLAAQKRKEQERGRQPIEPRDQMVGVAKVLPKDVSEDAETHKYKVVVKGQERSYSVWVEAKNEEVAVIRAQQYVAREHNDTAKRAAVVDMKQGVAEAGTVPTMPTSPTSATSTGTTSATQQKPLNLQAVQQQLKIPGNPAPGATSSTAAKPEDMAVQAIIQKVTAGKTLDPAETNLWHSILQKAK
jgi:hypothetical protein